MFETVRYDHQLILGDTYRVVGRLTQPPASPGVEGDPYDLTGVEGEVVVLREKGGPVLLSPTWAIVDAADGQFQWTATYGEVLDALEPGQWPFACRLTWADGTRDTVLLGLLTVLPALVP